MILETKITIHDFEHYTEVTNSSDLEVALKRRYKNGFNGFYISRHGVEYPSLIMLVKNDIATLTYLPKSDRPGFVSVGNVEYLDLDGITEFRVDTVDQIIEIVNYQIIYFSDALNAVSEFMSSDQLPTCLEWEEL